MQTPETSHNPPPLAASRDHFDTWLEVDLENLKQPMHHNVNWVIILAGHQPHQLYHQT